MEMGNLGQNSFLDEKKYVLWLTRIPGIGPARLRQIQARYGSLEAAWHHAQASELQQIAGIREEMAQQIVTSRQSFCPERELERLHRKGVRFCVIGEADYPAPLLSMHNPPPGLYMKGSWLPQDERAIAIVGTRRATRYGQLVTRQMTRALAEWDITIISGLARGIDSYAHEAALQAHGRTIAVLAGGFDHLYPRENRKLAELIEGRGALITEYPPEMEVKAGQFPARNRLIAALSRGVLVVEAGDRSGAIITADLALEQGKEVFAVPGPITAPSSAGTNQLIKEGAKLVTKVDDILEEFPDWRKIREKGRGKSQHPLLEQIGCAAVHIDDLHRQLGLPLPELHKLLLQLELAGRIRALPGGFYMQTEL